MKQKQQQQEDFFKNENENMEKQELQEFGQEEFKNSEKQEIQQQDNNDNGGFDLHADLRESENGWDRQMAEVFDKIDEFTQKAHAEKQAAKEAAAEM